MPATLWWKGALWIGTSAGLLRYYDGAAAWVPETHGGELRDIRTMAAHGQDELWLGMAGNGLACLKGHMIQRFTKADGLSSDFIECLHFDREGSLWIGTFGGGLDRMKNGHFAVINRNKGLQNNIVGDIESDDHGFLWMSSYNGIMRASEADLNRCADGGLKQVGCLSYGINDGLPTLQCSEGLLPAGCKTADGRLWFATAKGLVAVNPKATRINPRPPPVLIEGMSLDGKPFADGAVGGHWRIPPGRHWYEFQYTGLSFVVPEKVSFKCRLAGFDSDWVDMGAKRTANYNYIPPGQYSFQVIAGNNDGVWNEVGASLEFEVLPHFWQTGWFRFLTLATLVVVSGGMVWFETRRRMRSKLERAERQRDIEHERSRIARDIHDDLGAQLTRITMMSESARSGPGDAARMAQVLQHIFDTAHQLTRSMDEIVWAVNPRHDTLESLGGYFEKFAYDCLAPAGIRCRLDLPVQYPEWRLTSEVRHNLFLAAKEALHNVVKHAAATEVQIRLSTNPKSFTLEIEDNGCGFAAGQDRCQPGFSQGRLASGYGLENMARRLGAIDGSCDWTSAPGKGTRVVFTVPAKCGAWVS
jgi:signal transduction histidine kinase